MSEIRKIVSNIFNIPSLNKIIEFSQTLINTIVNNKKYRDTESFSYTKYKKQIDTYLDKEYMVILSQASPEFKKKYIELFQQLLHRIQVNNLFDKKAESNKRNIPIFSIKVYPVWEQYIKNLEKVYKKYVIGK